MNNWCAMLFILLIGKSLSFSQIETNTYPFVSWENAQTMQIDTVYAISFEKNKLNQLPAELAEYKQLKSLELGRNKLDSLPTFLSEFDSLQYLGFSKNQLNHFPISICKLTKLKFIDASRNNIEKLPNCISYMPNLQALDVWDTGLKSLPHDFEELAKQLKYLDLRGMTYSPDYIEKWKGLLPRTVIEHEPPCNCVK